MAWVSSILSRPASRRSLSSILFRKLSSPSPLSNISPAAPFSSSSASSSWASPSSHYRHSRSGSSGSGSVFFFCASAAIGAAVLLHAPEAASDSPPPPAPTPMPSARSMGGPVVTKSGHVIHKLKIFVGYDSREDLAYEVCRHSILKHATLPVEVIPIKQSDLRRNGLYSRARDSTESTEFSFTRFLTPYLAGYDGWAMFVDCDFLYTADIRELVELLDDRYAIMCVQHDFTPKTATKMDGVVQTTYPRKNWSSMVLYNCSHPKNKVLTPTVVSSQSGAFLHRFMWLDDKDIGSVPYTWNFLVGHNEMPKGSHILPKAIHYTSGGPWFEAWQNCDYAQEWIQERDEYQKTHMIQKVIQSELVQLLDRESTDREARFEDRLTQIESRLKEVSALQQLLLLYLQDRMVGNGGNHGNGKEASLKPEDAALLEERLAARSTRLYGKD